MDYNENQPYIPKPAEIAGIDLYGLRQKDGSILIGEKNPTHLKDFPENIIVCDRVYGLESISKNKDDCSLSETDKGYNIEWGIYC